MPYPICKHASALYLIGAMIFYSMGLLRPVAAQPLSGSYPFTEVPADFGTTTVQVPVDFTAEVIFREADPVHTSTGQIVPAKGHHDFVGYIPINGSSEHGYLFVNHETGGINPVLGDGGGMTYFEIQKLEGVWTVIGDYRNVDFSRVGGTIFNCGGTVTPGGTILTAEEFAPGSNGELGGTGFTDLSDWTLPGGEIILRHQNMGYMVEVVPSTGEVRKLYKMGRYVHECALVMPDRRTVYLTDDSDPAVFFKFVAEVPEDYTEGQLYAYKQSTDGQSGVWIPLPMDINSLISIRDIAISLGASLFIRHEWLTMADGIVYISETGKESFNWGGAIAAGGVPAKHHSDYHLVSGASFSDPYGRILAFDPASNRMWPVLEGGQATNDPSKHFSNPDGLISVRMNGRTYLVIHEDITGLSLGRVPSGVNRLINEIYWADLSITNLTVDDLQRFMIGPSGSETTGPQFTPDHRTFFTSIQHPDPSDPPPFNRSATIAVTGLWSETDTTPPIITLLGESTITLTMGAPYVEPGVIATDNVDSFVAVEVSGTVAADTPGAYLITYTATDASGNTAQVTRTVVVTAPEEMKRAVILATHLAVLKQEAQILSGNVIVNNQYDKTLHDGDLQGDTDEKDEEDHFEYNLIVGVRATTPSNFLIKGDRVRLKNGVRIMGDISYNNLKRPKRSVIAGAQHTPLALPVFPGLPPFELGTPGAQTIIVPARKTLTLSPGDYGHIQVKHGGHLVLTGGVYNIVSLNVEKKARVGFDAPSKLLVRENVRIDQEGYAGPSHNAEVGADGLIFYVSGKDNWEDEFAVTFGVRSTVLANVYAPNGTIGIRQGAQATGAFIGHCVIVGVRTKLALDSFLDQNAESIPAIATRPDVSTDLGENKTSNIPSSFTLAQNRPNPFNPSTQISYDLPLQAHIVLSIYNLLGQEVARLVDTFQPPGRYTASWNGRDRNGWQVASGIYFYRLASSTGFSESKRMMLIK